jgi:hypothetical protein
MKIKTLLEQEKREPKLEGHWYSDYEKHFPMPIHSDEALLAQPQFSYGQGNTDENHVRAFRGWSTCRCCQKHNGNKEYESNGWVWPEGFRHYISEHNIVPKKEFLKDVLNIEV